MVRQIMEKRGVSDGDRRGRGGHQSGSPSPQGSLLGSSAQMITVGLLVFHHKRKEGQGAYSPGLELDALIYKEALENNGFNVMTVKPWCAGRQENEENLQNLEQCDILIGYEEFGTKKLIANIRSQKRKGKLKAVVWVPNLECCQSYGKWKDVTDNLGLVDVIVGKTFSQAALLRRHLSKDTATMPSNSSSVAVSTPKEVVELGGNKSAAERLRKVASRVQIVSVPHTSFCKQWARNHIELGPELASSLASKLLNPASEKTPSSSGTNPATQIATRNCIIHFAGSSNMKNTLENVKAGIELIRRFPKQFSKLLVKITKWPKGNYSLDEATRRKIESIFSDNQHMMELDMEGYLSEAAKARLYRRSCLALCSSNAEGFGHYILEAASFGCAVVTTDGSPMRELLSTHVSLAKPKQYEPLNLGINYVIDANAIVAAAETIMTQLDHCLEEKCAQDCLSTFTRFHQHFNKDLCPILRALCATSQADNRGQSNDSPRHRSASPKLRRNKHRSRSRSRKRSRRRRSRSRSRSRSRRRSRRRSRSRSRSRSSRSRKAGCNRQRRKRSRSRGRSK